MYRHVSIKNTERSKRECKAADGMKCKNILARYGIKSWSKFLSVSSNKAELVKFLLEQWQNEEFRRLKLSDCTMYVTCEYECRKLNSADSERVDELQITKKQTPAWLCTHVMLEILELPSTQTIRTFWFSFSAIVSGLATASLRRGKVRRAGLFSFLMLWTIFQRIWIEMRDFATFLGHLLVCIL